MHLIVLQHGFGGKSSHMNFIERTFRSPFQLLSHFHLLSCRSRFGEDEIAVVNSAANAWLKSFDGVDICGERLVDLIKKCIEGFSLCVFNPPDSEISAEYGEKIDRISMVGYSMGGATSTLFLFIIMVLQVSLSGMLWGNFLLKGFSTSSSRSI